MDHCLKCGGTWLDPGELEQIAALAGITADEDFEEALFEGGSGTKSERICPRCERRLETYALQQGGNSMTVERCSKGEGLWLDQGELRRLLSHSGGEEAEAVSRFLADLFKYELETFGKGS